MSSNPPAFKQSLFDHFFGSNQTTERQTNQAPMPVVEAVSVPQEFTDPFSLSIMRYPVILNSGQSMEFKELETLLARPKSEHLCPITREPITFYTANRVLQALIDKFIIENPSFESDRYESYDCAKYNELTSKDNTTREQLASDLRLRNAYYSLCCLYGMYASGKMTLSFCYNVTSFILSSVYSGIKGTVELFTGPDAFFFATLAVAGIGALKALHSDSQQAHRRSRNRETPQPQPNQHQFFNSHRTEIEHQRLMEIFEEINYNRGLNRR